jgi:predicted dehydrogenase
MKVSIIGASRNRSGIGEYIGKYFHKNGAKVTSVLGTTEETSRNASSALRKYGIESNPYTDFFKMAEDEKPDAVAIASPSPTHYLYLLRCVELGLHIFCEKPFIRPDVDDISEKVEDIFEKVKEKSLTVAMNSQWPFAVKYYRRICGEIEIKKSNRFFMTMSPFVAGKEMIPEAVPHALSLLYCLLGEGEISDLIFESAGKDEVFMKFRYDFGARHCEVFVKLVKKEKQPRDFQFGLNDKIVRRSLNLKNYDIYLNYGSKRLKIADPLELSVRNFMAAVEKKVEPLVGYSHIVSNMSLLKIIYDAYREA